MTTIVYDHKNKAIAIDSRVTSAGQIMDDSAVKFIFKPDDSVWFYSGRPIDMRAAMNIFDSYENQCIKAPKNRIEFSSFIAFAGCAYYCYYSSSNEYVMEKATHNDGFGSGGIYALCAVNMGKSADEAVEFAKSMDIYSGGKVHVFSVLEMLFD